jgi:hypothetical protein
MTDVDSMNIKNLLGISGSVAPAKQASRVDRPIKSDSSHERDANGQQLYQREKKKEKMSQEQFDKAVSILREKNFIKEMKWIVVSVTENDVRFVCVHDQNNGLIRKISEFDLWDIFEDSKPDETKGQLLRKTA